MLLKGEFGKPRTPSEVHIKKAPLEYLQNQVFYVTDKQIGRNRIVKLISARDGLMKIQLN